MESLQYEQVRPPAALADTIECFWRLLAPLVHAPGEVLNAEGRAEILFQFEGQSQAIPRKADVPFECASSWLVRPYAHTLRVRQVGVSASAMIGVRFAPGGWAAFHHEDTTDNQPYSLMPLSDFYMPGEVRRLEQQLYDVLRTPYWAYPLVYFFSQRQLEPTHYDRIAHAADQLHSRQISVSTLAYDVNLSERQFGRVFRQIIGLSPKQYSRIARLNRVLYSQDYTTRGLTLTRIAHRYGYHDASHLIREFHELMGLSPTDYFSARHDLVEQKIREHDRFLQQEPDTM